MSDIFVGSALTGPTAQQRFAGPQAPARPGISAVTPRAAEIGGSAASEVTGESFSDMLFGSLNQVSALELEHSNLAVRAMVAPEEVDPHDVTIAAAQANLALSITRNVVDRVIQAYRDITNLR